MCSRGVGEGVSIWMKCTKPGHFGFCLPCMWVWSRHAKLRSGLISENSNEQVKIFTIVKIHTKNEAQRKKPPGNIRTISTQLATFFVAHETTHCYLFFSRSLEDDITNSSTENGFVAHSIYVCLRLAFVMWFWWLADVLCFFYHHSKIRVQSSFRFRKIPNHRLVNTEYLMQNRKSICFSGFSHSLRLPYNEKKSLQMIFMCLSSAIK